MAKEEADICIKALEIYKQNIQAGKIRVPDVFRKPPKANSELAINAERPAQLFDLKDNGEN